MELHYEDYGFYRIDKDYLEYLHNIDTQVFFKDEEDYDRKPHLGLLVNIEGYTYCIPLTYRFLSSYKKQIMEKAQELYSKQKETNIIKSCYVTFDKVETAYNDRFKERQPHLKAASCEEMLPYI